MKPSSWQSPLGNRLSSSISLLLIALTPFTQAITFNPVPPPGIDLTTLGRVGLAGDFGGISLYQFEGQNENGFNTNGSQSLLAQFPNGDFASLVSADASIRAMCSFTLKDGTVAGVVVGGNFTGLGEKESPGVAMFNPNTSAIEPLTGLSGQVSALLCDQETSTVYVGGSFKGENSTNALAWVGTKGWKNLPFAGFNGPVKSITKAPNGHIVFGGVFSGLGNATGPSLPDQQVINISGANITSGTSTSTSGFDDPTNIVCKTNGVSGSGETWLLEDNLPGFWKATFGFQFQPTKLRLWNTHLEGRGTKTWRYTAMPINGIMNFTYTDPATGKNASCSSECPLSSDTGIKFQDFHFVNVIGMNAFQIDISDWYGTSGGLNGIELFQDDISAYAINDFNEPTCAGIKVASNSTSTGPWKVTPSRQSASRYLTAAVAESASPNVVFLPDIRQSGNYSVNMYTPGCLQDDSCSTRGRVNVTGVMASGSTSAGFSREIFQTNNFDKYDQIYFGYIEAGSDSFRPSVTLAPSAGQNVPDLSVVAQRVGFTLISSTGGLNSLFEYDPSNALINPSDFANSTFNKAGMSLGPESGVNALLTSGSTTYVGGNFSTSTYKNILAIADSDAKPLAGGSLDGEVLVMFLDRSTLYAGGRFTKASPGGPANGLSGVAAYDTVKNTWTALGAGVNGLVSSIVPLAMNVTSNVPETVITFTGDFDQLLAFGKNPTVAVTGFAVWVPSRSNWLQNLNSTAGVINGALMASVELPGSGSLYAGSLSSSQLGANGAAELSNTLNPFPVHIKPSPAQQTGAVTRRDANNETASGVATGLFYNNGGHNITILGGHFVAAGSNGSDINNLIFINSSNSDTVTGIGSQISTDSTILALAVHEETLFAGGRLSGNVDGGKVNGLLSFNLATASPNAQPPALGGGDVTVNSITVRPDTADIYVGGSFSSAGSLECPAVCVLSGTGAQWNRPGSDLGGFANTMTWASPSSLIVGGSLSINGLTAPLMIFDAKSQNWTVANGADSIPGPVVAMAAANSDTSQYWVAGTSTNGSAFLMKYDGEIWNSVGNSLGSGTNIRGLEVLSLNKNHESSSLIAASQSLLITGSLNIPGFGNASAVLFNGTAFQPFALTSSTSNAGSSISHLFSEKQTVFTSKGGGIAKGFIVLIALGIALGLIFLLVVAGVVAERIRRKREGYVPAPTASYDKDGMSRIPPEQLFGSLGQGRSGIEKQSTRI